MTKTESSEGLRVWLNTRLELSVYDDSKNVVFFEKVVFKFLGVAL